MNDYDKLRHLADSWGLVFMGVTFLILVGWTFLPGSHERHRSAATMIFDDGENFDEERDDV